MACPPGLKAEETSRHQKGQQQQHVERDDRRKADALPGRYRHGHAASSCLNARSRKHSPAHAGRLEARERRAHGRNKDHGGIDQVCRIASPPDDPDRQIEAAENLTFGTDIQSDTAALHGLAHHRDRLAEDHANARAFAQRLAPCPALRLDLATVQTNIVVFHLNDGAPDAPALVTQARERGVLLNAFGPRTVRVALHLDVSAAQSAQAADILLQLLG